MYSVFFATLITRKKMYCIIASLHTDTSRILLPSEIRLGQEIVSLACLRVVGELPYITLTQLTAPLRLNISRQHHLGIEQILVC